MFLDMWKTQSAERLTTVGHHHESLEILCRDVWEKLICFTEIDTPFRESEKPQGGSVI